jgi:hypothetical protein
MGRKLLLLTLLVGLVGVSAAFAGDAPGDGTLSVKRGRGAIGIKFTGTVIGRLSGWIRVRDYRLSDDTVPQLLGCRSKVRHPLAGIYYCRGRNVSFRILDGKYWVTMKGGGIYLSAVGYGSVTIDGAGDEGVNDGVMSVNDEPYHSLPDVPETFPLEAPPPQPGG